MSRRWVPWRRRLKGSFGSNPLDLATGLGDDPISAIIFIILLILVLPFILLALIAGLEFLLLLLLLPFVMVGRALFGVHWTIEARKGYRIWWDAPSGDWQASGVRIHDVAAAIGRGELPPQTVDGPPPEAPEPTVR